MTIYDADYAEELAAQEQAVKTDSVAASPVAIESEALHESQDQVASASNEVEEQSEVISDKEMNFKALRESMAQMKAEREAERARFAQEMEMLKMQVSSQQVQKQEPKRVLDDQSDDDLLTVGKYRQTIREMQEEHHKEVQRLRLEQEETRARLQFSDYDEVLEKYSIPLLQNNRDFARAFEASENKASFAYELGRMVMNSQNPPRQAEQPAEMQPSQKAQRMVENAKKPGTLSSARGGQPTISKADYWASCSDEDFAKEMARNLAEV